MEYIKGITDRQEYVNSVKTALANAETTTDEIIGKLADLHERVNILERADTAGQDRTSQLNRVTLRGIIGNVRLSEIGEKKLARATIATNFLTRDSEGCALIESFWSNLVIFDGPATRDIGLLARGKAVEVTGRLRNIRYTASDGGERSMTDVLVSSLTVLGDTMLKYQSQEN